MVDRLAWIGQMVSQIRQLPLRDRQRFLSDWRNVWAAEPGLRRALEALFDLGRHILAKGFGYGASEYKEIAVKLAAYGVLTAEEAALLQVLAGYRNRLVHFYHEVEAWELYEICAHQLADVKLLAAAFRDWIADNPDRLGERL